MEAFSRYLLTAELLPRYLLIPEVNRIYIFQKEKFDNFKGYKLCHRSILPGKTDTFSFFLKRGGGDQFPKIDNKIEVWDKCGTSGTIVFFTRKNVGCSR